MESLDEFTLIGDDDDADLDFEELVPGVVKILHQRLSWEGGESWSRDRPAGFAQLSLTIGKGTNAICNVVFVLDDDNTIVANGVLPLADRTGFGNGLLAITGGTGTFDSVMGRIDVEVMNPKKYHFATRPPG